MPEIELPTGQYVSCNMGIPPVFGGLTRVMFLRNRLFQERGGVVPKIVVFRPSPDYAERRRELIDADIMTEQMQLISLYDFFRADPMIYADPVGGELAPVSGTSVVVETYPDGSPYRTAYNDPSTNDNLSCDYQRKDGSVYARVAALGIKATVDGGPRARLVGPDGQVVRSFSSHAAFYKHTVRRLCPGKDRVFVFMDSRATVPFVTPMGSDRYYLISVLHNQHTRPPRRWDSPMSPSYTTALNRLAHFDAMVTLTHRQREDVKLRYGPRTNLFVVPNPVRQPVVPDPLPRRDPNRLVSIARLENQKNIADALRAFKRVHDVLPEARLDVYGDGSQRADLSELAAKLGIDGAATLHGHHAGARDTLWTASGFLMPSKFEGYPLASLESLAHGCPVVAYDVKYGFQEQITDGEDGYLVPKGDVAAMAERGIRLLSEPDLVSRMSANARQKAARHGYSYFLQDWQKVLNGVLEQRPRRTTLTSADLQVSNLTPPRVRPRAVRRLLRRLGLQVSTEPRNPRISFSGTLTVEGTSSGCPLSEATITLTALGQPDGSLTDLPLQITNHDSRFELESVIDRADMFAQLGRAAQGAKLRLRFTWQNSSWETLLGDGAQWQRPSRQRWTTPRPKAPRRARRGIRSLTRRAARQLTDRKAGSNLVR
jgi:poly(glycerol-phosphate) alpha-glucosyltransferase